MTLLCEEKDGINLAQGFTDEPPPLELCERAMRAIREGPNYYSATYGMRCLREAVAEKLRRFNGFEANPETEVTITCGATEAIASSIFAVVDRRDEVIIIEPFYENYVPNVLLAEGVPRFVSLTDELGLPEEALKAAVGSRTRAIIINTPQNPNGKVYRREELAFIADLCTDYDLVPICDETYERFTYEAARHVSLASLKGMEERTLTVGTFSKSFAVSGWRVGYVSGSQVLSEGLRKVHDFLTVAAPTPLQVALASSLAPHDGYWTDLIRSYQRKREILGEVLRETGFSFAPPQGAYYILSDISRVWEEDDIRFSHWLLDSAGIATVPGSSFYSNSERGRTEVRFAFCRSEGTLQDCAQRLRSVLGSARGKNDAETRGVKE